MEFVNCNLQTVVFYRSYTVMPLPIDRSTFVRHIMFGHPVGKYLCSYIWLGFVKVQTAAVPTHAPRQVKFY